MPQEFKSLKGQLLLDSGELRGSCFNRSVVLICQHDLQGAFGLILNQPSPNKVGEMLMAELPESIKEMNFYIGGPVQNSALSYLHSDDFLPDANVMPNLSLGHSLEDLVDLGQSFASTQKLRLFAGYAGWSPGQLENEMKRKAWLTHPATIDLVFHEEANELWPEILKIKGWKYRLIADAPEDLSHN
jgi:putative transcriptional regulator